MGLRNFFKYQIAIFVFSGMLLTSLTDLYAEDPAVPWTRARASALVAVQSVGIVGSVEQRRGGSGTLPFANRTRSLRFNRNGSGVIIDRRGILVTNDHIVRNANSISVTFSDGTRVRARVVGAFPANDLAFLSIVPPFALNPVPFADSDKISKGMRVYSIGRSLWHHNTWFRGKVTGMMAGMLRGRPHISLLQATFGTEFYLGDSGSPVFDQHGKLLGIIVAGRRNGDKATFAVTSNFIRDAFQNIREKPSRVLKNRFDTNAGAFFLNRLRKISGDPSPLVAAP